MRVPCQLHQSRAQPYRPTEAMHHIVLALVLTLLAAPALAASVCDREFSELANEYGRHATGGELDEGSAFKPTGADVPVSVRLIGDSIDGLTVMIGDTKLTRVAKPHPKIWPHVYRGTIKSGRYLLQVKDNGGNSRAISRYVTLPNPHLEIPVHVAKDKDPRSYIRVGLGLIPDAFGTRSVAIVFSSTLPSDDDTEQIEKSIDQSMTGIGKDKIIWPNRKDNDADHDNVAFVPLKNVSTSQEWARAADAIATGINKFESAQKRNLYARVGAIFDIGAKAPIVLDHHFVIRFRQGRAPERISDWFSGSESVATVTRFPPSKEPLLLIRLPRKDFCENLADLEERFHQSARAEAGTTAVEVAEPDLMFRLYSSAGLPGNWPGDRRYGSRQVRTPDGSHTVQKIRAAWNELYSRGSAYPFGDPVVNLAILDDGIDWNGTDEPGHYESACTLKEETMGKDSTNKIRFCFDFQHGLGCDNSNYDPDYLNHGIAVFAVAAACTNNGSNNRSEIAGIALGTHHISARRHPGLASATMYANSLRWLGKLSTIEYCSPSFCPPLDPEGRFATRLPADIINISHNYRQIFGWPTSIKDAFDELVSEGRKDYMGIKRGVVIVHSAGNNGEDMGGFDPQAHYCTNIAVANCHATAAGQIQRWFGASPSNYGQNLDVCAIGNGAETVKVRCNNNEPCEFTGTSAAAPTVSGVVALMLSVNPRLRWCDVKQLLRDSALRLPNAPDWGDPMSDRSLYYGSGLLDALEALKDAMSFNAPNTPCPVPITQQCAPYIPQ